MIDECKCLPNYEAASGNSSGLSVAHFSYWKQNEVRSRPIFSILQKLQSFVLMCCPIHLHSSAFYCAGTNSAVMPEIAA